MQGLSDMVGGRKYSNLQEHHPVKAPEGDNTDVDSWTTTKVANWLDQLGLGGMAPKFADNKITGDLMSMISEAHLKEMGMSNVGERLLLLDRLAGGGGADGGAVRRADIEGARALVPRVAAAFVERWSTLHPLATAPRRVAASRVPWRAPCSRHFVPLCSRSKSGGWRGGAVCGLTWPTSTRDAACARQCTRTACAAP